MKAQYKKPAIQFHFKRRKGQLVLTQHIRTPKPPKHSVEGNLLIYVGKYENKRLFIKTIPIEHLNAIMEEGFYIWAFPKHIVDKSRNLESFSKIDILECFFVPQVKVKRIRAPKRSISGMPGGFSPCWNC